MHTVCNFCERIFSDFKGWVVLLDMDNVVCHREDPTVIDIETCKDCDQFDWADFVSPAEEWWQNYEEEKLSVPIEE
jgi:hypothetical protein